jgi:uncharacterized membrane protein YdbT with pleckstrin-like domain
MSQTAYPQPRRRPERELWTGHPSWKAMIGWYVKWEGLALAISVAAWFIHSTGNLSWFHLILVLLVFNGFVLLVGRVLRSTTTYQITNKRVRGYRRVPSQMFRLHLEEAPIARIDNVTVEQSLLGQMLGVGTIDFDTAGEKDGDILKWWGVEDPRDVAAKIENVLAGDDEWEDEPKAAVDPDDPQSPYFRNDPRLTQPGYIEEH